MTISQLSSVKLLWNLCLGLFKSLFPVSLPVKILKRLPLFNSNILLKISYFSNIFSLHSSFNVKYHVLGPFSTITYEYIPNINQLKSSYFKICNLSSQESYTGNVTSYNCLRDGSTTGYNIF